jgi:hypothetical protein
MKKATLLLCAVCCLTLAGCARIWGPTAEVEALIKEKDDCISEISKKLEASPNEAGVDEARKVFESHKASFEAKAKVLSDAPRGMNGDWLSRLAASESYDSKIFMAMWMKFGTDCKGDCSAAQKKLHALEDDFNTAVRMK